MSEMKVPGCGPSKARIMIVGEAPGRQEELERTPFVGPSGELLRGRLMAVGINPSEVYFTNICKYRPPGNELRAWFDKKTGTPDMKVLEGMLELREEIEAVDPHVIVALGNYPLWALTRKAKWKKTGDDYGYTGISDWRGSIIEGARGIAEGRKVVATYHPAAVLRKYPWLQTLHLDLARVRDQSLYPEIRRPERELIIDPKGGDRDRERDWLLNTGSIITFDIEQIKSNLLCIGFTVDKKRSVVIRTRTAADIAWCRDILLSGKPLAAQNGIFDCSMLEYWHRMPGLLNNLKYDTMLASHAAYIELPKDLGFLCSIYTEQPCYWTNVNWRQVEKELALGSTSTVDSVDFLTYNAIDTWVTHDIMEQQLGDELLDERVKRTFDFEMKLVPALWDMSKIGMKVDKNKMDKIRLQCLQEIDEAQPRLEALAGHPLNTRSPLQVQKLLFNELGMKPIKKGKKGAPSADDKTLAELDIAATDPLHKGVITLIRSIRKNRSLISKFTEIEYDADGRMRCHYKPAGTTTGRLSSSKFFPTGTGANLQNIPRDKRVRSVFVPDEGYTFFYNDLERAESLVVAKLTGDPTMLRHHSTGADAHSMLASLLFYDNEDTKVTEEERYMGKQTRHAGNYMEGWRTFQINVNKIANVTGVSIDAKEAKFFINKYRSLHPYLGQWWRETEAQLRKPGHRLYNLLGRPRTFYDRLENVLPTAIAYVPQSTIGDVLNTGLLRCAEDEELRDYDCQLLVQVHDAIGGQVKNEYAIAAMRRMQTLLTVDLEVPKTGEVFQVPVELTIGPSWGECKKIAAEKLAA